MPLDADTIQRLLANEGKRSRGGAEIKAPTDHPRPKQLGPLRWHNISKSCVSRGCGSPTLITVRGIRYCTTHALNVLNQVILTELEGVDISVCTCKSGLMSKNNIHTHDCELYASIN